MFARNAGVCASRQRNTTTIAVLRCICIWISHDVPADVTIISTPCDGWGATRGRDEGRRRRGERGNAGNRPDDSSCHGRHRARAKTVRVSRACLSAATTPRRSRTRRFIDFDGKLKSSKRPPYLSIQYAVAINEYNCKI
ncbi:uncharacterized protein LOC105185946 [Harpegnathos saltator]|uniref:uncharacterized protein LOC105185946 n=1 Tax=Harpegnathos saltator TaxID=610380 RepID=UPI0005917A45|nr:uncharacterized protein LOC105185946 [Harpegnathos saltator]